MIRGKWKGGRRKGKRERKRKKGEGGRTEEECAVAIFPSENPCNKSVFGSLRQLST